MSELSALEKLKQIPNKLMKILNLEKIDQHDSLTFLYKNYRIHPSELITAIIAFVVVVVMALDGCNIIASFVCFVLPLANCLKQLASNEEKRQLNFVKISSSDQISRMTDQQFSQILSSNKKHHSTIKIHIVYFICYTILEIISPLMIWMVGPFSWLIIRCFFTMGMLSSKIGGAVRIIDLLKHFFKSQTNVYSEVQDAPQRRNASLLNKM